MARGLSRGLVATPPKIPYERLPDDYRRDGNTEFLKFGNRCLESINGLIDQQNAAKEAIFYALQMAASARSAAGVHMISGGCGEFAFAYAHAKSVETCDHAQNIKDLQKKVDIIKRTMQSANSSNYEVKESKMLLALRSLDDPTAILFPK